MQDSYFSMCTHNSICKSLKGTKSSDFNPFAQESNASYGNTCRSQSIPIHLNGCFVAGAEHTQSAIFDLVLRLSQSPELHFHVILYKPFDNCWNIYSQYTSHFEWLAIGLKNKAFSVGLQTNQANVLLTSLQNPAQSHISNQMTANLRACSQIVKSALSALYDIFIKL